MPRPPAAIRPVRVRGRLTMIPLTIGALVMAACGSSETTTPTSPPLAANEAIPATDPPATSPAATSPPAAEDSAPESTDTAVTETPVTEPIATGPDATEPVDTEPIVVEPVVPDAVAALGYPVSNDYVVETVIADLPAATGGLAFDADGNIYSGDFGGFDNGPGNRVLKITPELSVEDFIVSDEMGKNTSTVFGPDGTLYQSSFGTGKFFAISPDGELSVLADGLSGPTGIAVRDDGSILVQGYLGNKIYEVGPDGTVSDWSTGPGLNGPNGMVVGPDGEIYAVNHRNGAIFTFDDDGVATELHRFPEETAHVAYLDDGLFVTSRANVVFRYDLATGDVVIIAGTGAPGSTDGRGVEASFGRPNAITVGPDGALYMNHGDDDTYLPATIRRISYDPQ